ncbi:hypothetical protein ABZ297_37035 [Nonomuraea sp. NPDC005983]
MGVETEVWPQPSGTEVLALPAVALPLPRRRPGAALALPWRAWCG